MGMTLPDFAKPIADARADGKRPFGMVLVSDGDLGLHRRYPDNPVVRVRPEQRPSSLSWRFLADLDVEVVTDGDNLRRAVALAAAVRMGFPRYLCVRNLATGAVVRVVWCWRTMVVPETLCT